MPEDRSRRTPHRAVLAAVACAFAFVMGGLLYVVTDHGPFDNAAAPTPRSTATTSASASASPSLTLVPTTAPPVLGALSPVGSPLADRVRAALGNLAGGPALGGAPGVVVLDGATGASLVDLDGASARIPASTTKLLTAAAALEVLGPDAHFTTSVVSPAPGQIVLVGGGDPALSQRTGPDDDWAYAVTPLADLATTTVTALRAQGVVTVQLAYAADYFAGPSVNPNWPASYVSTGQVGPIAALALDGSRRTPGMAARTADPPAYAAERFAALLTAGGVAATVTGEVSTPVGGPVDVASIDSPSVADLVSQMLVRSDNDVAETLARQVARAAGQPASFAGVQPALTGVLATLRIPTAGLALADGSGLARSNQIAPTTLAATLLAATYPDHDELRPLLTGLPVAGFTGTLAERFDDPAGAVGAGDIRAKTGYLSGVVALAGYVRDQNDQVLIFAFVANGVSGTNTIDAQKALDDMAVRLAGCGCS